MRLNKTTDSKKKKIGSLEVGMGKIGSIFLVLFVGGLVISGCGPKKVVNTEVPAAPQAEETPTPVQSMPTVMPTSTPTASKKYTVKKGDTLWAIAGKSEIYSDSFEWPILYKANRDLIQDPDLIYANQVLAVKEDISPDEKDKAVKAASDTPNYERHEKARTTLPVDYF
jgi:nucleoid-associated protein YgaU